MGLHDGHRQRSKRRYLALGAEGMEDHQLLELLLFYAIPRQDTNETAHRLIQRFRLAAGGAPRRTGGADLRRGRGRKRRRAGAATPPSTTRSSACATAPPPPSSSGGT